MDPQNQPQQERRFRGWLFLLLIPVAILVFILFLGSGDKKSEMKYSELIGYFQDEQVESFDLSFHTGEVKVLLRENARRQCHLHGRF